MTHAAAEPAIVASPITVADFARVLDRLAPPELDEAWDNTGLLWGDAAWPAPGCTTCLTLTPDVAAEAVARGDGLVVTHHPVLFRPVQRVTADDPQGRMLLKMAAAKVAVYSPHARWDNAAGGINDLLCERFGLTDVRPLRARDDLPGDAPRGAGRIGTLPDPLPFANFANRVRDALDLPGVDAVPTDRAVRTVGVACGSAGRISLRRGRRRLRRVRHRRSPLPHRPGGPRGGRRADPRRPPRQRAVQPGCARRTTGRGVPGRAGAVPAGVERDPLVRIGGQD